jgi:tRNA 2-selenouridine synthase
MEIANGKIRLRRLKFARENFILRITDIMRSPIYTKTPWQENYSEIIDVRSENEFAADHILEAINLPVLNNEERAKVGTIYKQVSPFEARKMGAALVSKNISQHLNIHFANKDKNYAPLIYCWRGGQRSNSLALVLAQIGWQVTVLEGGYQTYRAYVRQQLATLPLQFHYKILCGLTGTGKTHLLHQLSQQGEQILDLEKLANHRGSLLGQQWKENLVLQPSQKKFESLLLRELQQFETSKIVWVESESNKIGEIYLPLIFWEQMKQASCVEIQLPIAIRIKWLLQEYPHLVSNPELLKNKLKFLKNRYGRQKVEQWFNLIARQKFRDLIYDLLVNHYDPAYQRSLEKTFRPIEKVVAIPDLSLESIECFIEQCL